MFALRSLRVASAVVPKVAKAFAAPAFNTQFAYFSVQAGSVKFFDPVKVCKDKYEVKVKDKDKDKVNNLI